MVPPTRDELIKTALLAGGALGGQHIEKPDVNFVVAVLRPGYFSFKGWKPERWYVWRIQAETAGGAIKIAEYHFPEARDIEFLGKEVQQNKYDKEKLLTWENKGIRQSISVIKRKVT